MTFAERKGSKSPRLGLLDASTAEPASAKNFRNPPLARAASTTFPKPVVITMTFRLGVCLSNVKGFRV